MKYPSDAAPGLQACVGAFPFGFPVSGAGKARREQASTHRADGTRRSGR